MIKSCIVCGKEFETHGASKTCSDGCRRMRTNQRTREWRARVTDNPAKSDYFREYSRRYRQNHREQNREYGRKYYRQNRAAIRKYQQNYRKRNRELCNKRRMTYYWRHHEKYLEQYREKAYIKRREAENAYMQSLIERYSPKG